jgi:uncharacterized protein involved in exopolysaccharide biosynthesis
MRSTEFDVGREDPVSTGPGQWSLIDLASVVLRHRHLFILIPGALALAVVALVLAQARTYTATASLVPNSSGQQTSRMGVLAAQLGFAVPAPEGGLSPAFYRALLDTREILGSVVDHEYSVVTPDGARLQGDLVALLELEPARGYSARDLAIRTARGMISTRVDDMTGIVTVAVTSEYEALSEAMARRVLDALIAFDMETRQTRAAAERRFAETRRDSARMELRQAEDQLQSFLQQNRQYATSPTLLFEYNRLQGQVLVRQEVYRALAQSFEKARIDEVRNTPVITILEAPEGSSQKDSRGGFSKLILALILGSGLAFCLALGREFARRAREANRVDYQEFVRLRQEAVRRLVPWRRNGGDRRAASVDAPAGVDDPASPA